MLSPNAFDWPGDTCSLAPGAILLQRGHAMAHVYHVDHGRVALGVLDNGYGVGWNIQHIDGVALVGHGGATNGFRAHLVTVPERGFALAMLTNGDAGAQAMEEVRRWALRHALGLDVPLRETIEREDELADIAAARAGSTGGPADGGSAGDTAAAQAVAAAEEAVAPAMAPVPESPAQEAPAQGAPAQEVRVR